MTNEKVYAIMGYIPQSLPSNGKKENSMKKTYETPEIEVILVKNEDILTGSNDLEDLENPFAL